MQGTLASLGLTRIDRLLEQRRRGEIYRVRRVHAPFEGQFGLEHWPGGLLVSDTVRVPVPGRAARGTYTVRVAWMEEPLLPNLSLRDALTDADLYEGIPVGRVEVIPEAGSSVGNR